MSLHSRPTMLVNQNRVKIGKDEGFIKCVREEYKEEVM
jgi:hypothetical protein